MKKIINLLLILIVSTSYAAVDDVFWFGGTGDWMTQSNWTEDITDGAKWAIPGWVVGNPYNTGGSTSFTWNYGRAIIRNGTAKITSSSYPDGRVNRCYVIGSSGANLEISNDVTFGQLNIGTDAGTTGAVTQSSGSVSATGVFAAGGSGNAVYNLNGGTLSLPIPTDGSSYLGYYIGSHGDLNINGGTLNWVYSGTTADASKGIFIGRAGTGKINQTGGTSTITAAGSHVVIGYYNGAVHGGFVDVSGGTMNISTPNLRIGYGTDGYGTINVGGSGIFNFTGTNCVFGSWLRSGGEMNISGGTVNINATNCYFGAGSDANTIGTLNISGGVCNLNTATNGKLAFGYTNNAKGIINISGGQLNTSISLALGYYFAIPGICKGTINQTGGTIKTGSNSEYDVLVGRSGNGEYNISGGVVDSNWIALSRWYDAATQPLVSNLTISGGTLNLKGGITTWGANDVVKVSGSDASIGLGQGLIIRNSGTLAFELDAGGVSTMRIAKGSTSIQNIKLKVSTLPDYVGHIGATYDLISVSAGYTINMTGVTFQQETGAKHTFSYAVVDDGNGGQILRLTEIQGTCGDSLHPTVDADLNGDCVVDYRDLRELAQGWLNCSFNCP